MTPRILPESTVLAPRSLEIDEWEEFDLTDVTVFDPNGDPTEPVNLLHAAAYHPLTVRGRLGKLPKDVAHKCLIGSVQPSLAIELSDVKIFSYGTYMNGQAAVWAAGKAGWYSVGPSSTYRPMYEQMQEAVKLLYFIANSYAKPEGKGAKPAPNLSATAIFQKYAAEKMRKGATPSEAAEIMYRHRIFLLASMVQQLEGIAWSQNPFYLHLKGKFYSDWERVRRWLNGPAPTAQSQRTRPRGESIDSTSTSSSLKRKRGQPPVSQPVDVISVGSSSAASSVAKGVSGTSRPAKDSQPPQLKFRPVSSHARSTRSRDIPTPAMPLNTPDLQQSRSGVDEDSDTDTNPAPRKGKSALRLKPSKSVKGPRRNAKPPENEEDEERDHLAPSPTPAPAPRRPRHHPATPLDLDEGISMPTSPSSTSPSASPGALDHILDPIAEDTWRCALVGCTHRVYAASQPESQELIKKHYAMHASDDDERVKLVQRLAQPSLPAGRLIERVRMQARCDLGGFEGSRVAGSRFPGMVVRRV